jgi:hypothetical protein
LNQELKQKASVEGVGVGEGAECGCSGPLSRKRKCEIEYDTGDVVYGMDGKASRVKRVRVFETGTTRIQRDKGNEGAKGDEGDESDKSGDESEEFVEEMKAQPSPVPHPSTPGWSTELLFYQKKIKEKCKRKRERRDREIKLNMCLHV